jgi:hypothetical protein
VRICEPPKTRRNRGQRQLPIGECFFQFWESIPSVKNALFTGEVQFFNFLPSIMQHFAGDFLFREDGALSLLKHTLNTRTASFYMWHTLFLATKMQFSTQCTMITRSKDVLC